MTIETPPAGRSRGRDTVTALAIIGAFALILIVLRVLVFPLFTTPSASMEPTIQEGDTLLGSRFAHRAGAVQRGDLAAFRVSTPERSTRLARIVGLPGDRVQMKAGRLYLNGQALPRTEVGEARESTPYGAEHDVTKVRETLPGGKTYLTNDFGPEGDWDDTDVYVVPPQTYFVLGDNRDNSADSRIPAEQGGTGYSPAANLVARIDWILYSPKRGKAFFRP